nr:hypothetical protein [Tanacetum cinerariifolium]
VERSQSSADESVDEGIPEKEPRFDDEEAHVQKALEESLKSVYDALWGPLLPVVIKEPDSGKYQPLPEAQRKGKEKGKEKVSDEQVALDLLTLQTPKKKSPIDHEVESDEDVLRIDAGVQDEGHVGPNPGEQDEGQAGPNPGDVAMSQPQSGPVVHVGLNLKHIDLEATDVSTQLHPEQMDEGFTTTAYPNVQENLKLTVEEHVILDEPTSSTKTLSSLQHLAKDLSFGDLFFNDKPSEADNEKTTAKTKAESMVSVTIQQDTSSIPPMTTPIIDLTSGPDSPNHIDKLEQIMASLIQDNKHLEERLDSHGARLYTLENLDIPQQGYFTNECGKTNSYKTHEDHMMLYKPLEKSMNRDHTDELLKDLAEARKKKKKRHDSSKMPPGSPPYQPPPPPPPADQSHGSTAPSSSKTAALAEYKVWTMTNTRLRLFVSSAPKDIHMDDDMAPDAQVHSSDDEDIRNAYIPKASALASTYSPTSEDLLLVQTGDMAMFMDWFCKRQRIIELKPQDLEGLAFELVKLFHPNVIHLYKGSRLALSISKMKAAYYLDVVLEQMVPDQMWIEEECKYDIAAMYGISHWWFQRQRFYIDRHTSEGDRRAIRTHMRILSVVRIKVFSMHGYNYMKKIVLHRADLNEHIIAERDFKYLYPSDFEDLYLLNLQGHLNHLPPKDKKILPTVVNL